jgi:hypothetical protein
MTDVPPEVQKAIADIKANERDDVAGEFLKQLKERGLSDRDLEKQLNLSTHHANRMNAEDISELAAFTYHNYPDIFRDVLTQKPASVKFLSNPLMGAVLSSMAVKWLGNRRNI